MTLQPTLDGHIPDHDNELVPCPFCGGRMRFWTYSNDSRDYFDVDCTRCPCQLRGFESRAAAVAACNRRPLVIQQLPLLAGKETR